MNNTYILSVFVAIPDVPEQGLENILLVLIKNIPMLCSSVENDMRDKVRRVQKSISLLKRVGSHIGGRLIGWLIPWRRAWSGPMALSEVLIAAAPPSCSWSRGLTTSA